MARKNIKVDFGYKEDTSFKGTVFVIDSFENSIEKDLNRLLRTFDERDFEKVILYPLHENTLKRMSISVNDPYFTRLKKLEDKLLDVRSYIPVDISKLDGKRKKYTPIDFILTHLTELSKKPYFLCLSKNVANEFANYSSFDNWIKQIRLIIVEDKDLVLNEKLEKKLNRIDFI